ncbi:MAG: hypothetical protein ABIF88_03175 [archaeon]
MNDYDKFSCEFKNESECEEELNDAGIEMEYAEAQRFGGKDGEEIE